jgi:hypothetical protein
MGLRNVVVEPRPPTSADLRELAQAVERLERMRRSTDGFAEAVTRIKRRLNWFAEGQLSAELAKSLGLDTERRADVR